MSENLAESPCSLFVELHITNAYADGHECERLVKLRSPYLHPAQLEKFWDEAFTETGCFCHPTGFYADTDAVYEVEIVDCAVLSLVGERHEWGG